MSCGVFYFEPPCRSATAPCTVSGRVGTTVCVYIQDLTVTIASQRSDHEIILEEDVLQRSTINVESFVDEQEWRLYDEVDTFQGSVSKFYQGDHAENCIHPTFSCRTHATRRAGFYITNIFVVMVRLSPNSLTYWR